MDEACPLPNLLEFVFFFDRLCACKFANSHHVSFTLYLFSVLSHIFTLFNHLCALFYVGFTLFIVLLDFIISQPFSFYTSTIFLWHAVSHSGAELGGCQGGHCPPKFCLAPQ